MKHQTHSMKQNWLLVEIKDPIHSSECSYYNVTNVNYYLIVDDKPKLQKSNVQKEII